MRARVLAVVVVVWLSLGCDRGNAGPQFACVGAYRTITATSAYPIAMDPARVGTYPADTKSGAGYFYDNVLEYRVWLHPEKGAAPLNGKADYFVAFAEYEAAEKYSKASSGAEHPLVLVRQVEWIDEPEPGHYIPEKGERVTEWQVKWLAGSKRTEHSIKDFLAHPRPRRVDPDDNGGN